MNSITRSTAIAMLALAFVISAPLSATHAEDKTAVPPAATSWIGFLCDAGCGAKFAKMPMKAGVKSAMEHPKSCSMDAKCAAAGYGIFSAGKFYPFDKAGNAKAAALFAATTKDKGEFVEVTGTLNGQTIAVTTLKEKTGKPVKN